MLSRTKVDQIDDAFVTGLLVVDGSLARVLYLDSIESIGE